MSTPSFFGNEFVVNRTTFGIQEYADVVALAGGGFALAWVDRQATTFDVYVDDIRAQTFDARGGFAGAELLVNTITLFRQLDPQLVAMAGGGLAVTWTDLSQSQDDNSSTAIRMQQVHVGGRPQGGEQLVNTTTLAGQSSQDGILLRDGRFLVVWSNSVPGTGEFWVNDLRGQVFNADGTRSGAEYQLAAVADVALGQPALTRLADGRVLLTWEEFDITQSGGAKYSIHGLVLGAAGRPQGDAFLVAQGLPTREVFAPEVTALADGGFVVTYTDRLNTWENPTIEDPMLKVFDAAGTLVATRSAAEFNAGHQYTPTLTALKDGRFIAIWVNEAGGPDDTSYAVMGRVFLADGSFDGEEFRINTTTAGYQVDPRAATLADGRVVVSWTDYSATGDDTSSSAIRAQIIDPREAGIRLVGTAIEDDWVGTSFADRLLGQGGRDRVEGGRGDDTITGGSGRDSLAGGFGNDRLDGGQDADRLTGNAGNDVFVFGPASGQDRITDFGTGADRIDLQGFAFATAAQALARFTVQGPDLVFAMAGQTLTLAGGAALEIQATDLIL